MHLQILLISILFTFYSLSANAQVEVGDSTLKEVEDKAD